jgi:hypothetical protein
MKLPVFFHIPKNAGTYIFNRLFSACTLLNRPDYRRFGVFTIRICEVLKDGVIAYRFLVRDLNNYCNYSTSFSLVDGDDTSYQVNYKDWLREKNNLEIKGLCVQDISFLNFKEEQHEILNDNEELYFFTCLREAYDRAQSLFSYLKSTQSQHESTHGALGSLTFENYINSIYLEDSWLIRTLNRIPDSEPITDDDYKKSIDFLSTVHVFNMQSIDEQLRDIIQSCYDFDLEKWYFHDIYLLNIVKNETKNKICIPFEQLEIETQSTFLNRTARDRQLYKHFTQDANITQT